MCTEEEATFLTNDCISRYNLRICGSQHPNKLFDYARDTPKLNMGCGLPHDCVEGHLFLWKEPLLEAVD
jgi:hypothetical protein